MKNMKQLVIYFGALFLITMSSDSVIANDHSISVGPYVLTYDHTFRSSDDVVTIRFDVQPDVGSEIPCTSEKGGVYSPVFIALQVNDILTSGSINTFYSNEEKCVSPYILFALTVSEYQKISGQKCNIVFITPERPYKGKNWTGEGNILF